jgi:isopentenyl-diphosphate delta-isomerase
MIESRKLDHINIALEKAIESKIPTGFEEITLVHSALPEVNETEIDLSTTLMGRKFEMPIVIAGMTGGHPKAKRINRNLALAAQEMGIPMGVGSQRAALEDAALVDTYSIAREVAPDAFLIGNLGAVQFSQGYGSEEARKAVEMIQADALAIHLNPLQEAIQPEGERDFRGCLDGIRCLRDLGVPLIGKEVGTGLSREVATALEKAGVTVLDVGGLGGTSFAAVEHYRERGETLGAAFRDWGIPTAVSTIECLEATRCEVISTGGIRTGIEVAKALALGATACGFALPFLEKALTGPEEVVKELHRLRAELRVAMFLLGAGDLPSLRRCDLVIHGKTREWLEARGIDCRKYSNRKITEVTP